MVFFSVSFLGQRGFSSGLFPDFLLSLLLGLEIFHLGTNNLKCLQLAEFAFKRKGNCNVVVT